MSVKLLTEHHLEFLCLTGGCTGSSESTLVKMPHCWKSHVAAHLYFCLQEKVAKTACMSACKHIAVSLKDFLLDNNVTQMTLSSLQQFSLDLVQCEGK